MLVAVISYILLHIYLARLKAQRKSNLDEQSKAEAVAKVAKIINVINRIVALWFKFLLWAFIVLAVAAILALGVSIFGIATDAEWLVSIELLEFGTVAQIVGEYGFGKVVSAISLSLVLLGVLAYLAKRILGMKRLWRHAA